jgi:hypothetical protein
LFIKENVMLSPREIVQNFRRGMPILSEAMPETIPALQAGCRRQEFLKFAGKAIVFGGGPVLASSATLLLECLDEFTK